MLAPIVTISPMVKFAHIDWRTSYLYNSNFLVGKYVLLPSIHSMYVYNVCIQGRACMAIVATDRQSGNQIPTGFTNPAVYQYTSLSILCLVYQPSSILGPVYISQYTLPQPSALPNILARDGCPVILCEVSVVHPIYAGQFA